MKIKITGLLLFCNILLAMQPQQETIAQLSTYTLVGSDNSEVQVSGDLVRKYAPGLAQKFRIGFPEAQTGKVIIHDLDKQGLQNFKTLLEESAKIEEILRKRNDEIVQETNQARESIVLPLGQKQQEIEKQGKVLMEGMLKVVAMFNEAAIRIKDLMVELPNIGDHFLPLFNIITKWNMPYSLELALAKFAAEHLNIAQGYKELTKLGVTATAQLYYLQEVDLTIDSSLTALAWFMKLSDLPEVKALTKNAEILEKVRNKIIDFITINIKEILKKQPQFRHYILFFPKNTEIADLLRARIIEYYAQTFEKKIIELNRGNGLFQALDKERILINTPHGNFIINLKTGETSMSSAPYPHYLSEPIISLDSSHRLLKNRIRIYTSTGLPESEYLLIDSNTNKVLRIFPHYLQVTKLDKNHIAAIFSKTQEAKVIQGEFRMPQMIDTVLLTFIPEVSTLAEILDELSSQSVREEVRAKRPAPAAADAPRPKQQREKKTPVKRVKKEEQEPK